MSPQTNSADPRRLLLTAKHGILATVSLDVEGFPFGSVVPYCLDRQGRPLLLIADIAQHTRNVEADPRVSLTVADEASEGDVQAKARLTYLARAERVEEAAARQEAAGRYHRFYPWSREYYQTHGFSFYRLEPVRLRYIGGFGDIRWVEPADFAYPNPFSAAQEAAILEHMNDDHAAAMRHYCRQHGLDTADDQEVQMVGIDAEGFDLLFGRRPLRFTFDEPVATPEEARQRLVAMARA